ncbi:MAG: DUF4870 domain-containing protein [Acidimicrobiia bacterium]|nr:DUF4870 domain-containing protein [Acidimicrobiia bacterium]MDH3397567.1 DUF4870 domain-containing protein [Acidimicrobiia bacterium]MDH5616751.1 DUF4870 domain-containing protein [Acidimicrobiia bacterium]
MTTQTAETYPTTYEVSSNSRNLATLSHLSAFITFVGIPSLVGPLVMWLLNRDDPFVEQQAKDALNFNISFLLYGVVATFSIILLVGLIALPVVLITWFVLVIVAAVKAGNGENYQYPFTIRFVS